MSLDLVGVKCLALIRVNDRGDHIRPLVHVREKQSRANGRLSVESGATVTVPASSDLEVEGAVHPVFLCSEYRCQMLRHAYFFKLQVHDEIKKEFVRI